MYIKIANLRSRLNLNVLVEMMTIDWVTVLEGLFAPQLQSGQGKDMQSTQPIPCHYGTFESDQNQALNGHLRHTLTLHLNQYI